MTTACEVGLTPEAFWRMTAPDFIAAVEGYNRRQEHETRRLAWAVANIMNLWTKRKVTPEQLLGKSKTIDAAAFTSAEEFREALARRGDA